MEILFIIVHIMNLSKISKSAQFNVVLTITGAIRGSSRENLYQELSLESLKLRRWYRKFFILQKIEWALVFQTQKNEHRSYLFDIISKILSTGTSRSHNNILLFNVKHEYLWSPFLPSTLIEWSMLDNNIRNSESVIAFKKQILKCIRPSIAQKL